MDNKPKFKLHPKKEHLESYNFESSFLRKTKESGYNGHQKAQLLAFFPKIISGPPKVFQGLPTRCCSSFF